MRDNSGQEHRAFMAILLAMAVLFAWSYLFPTTRPPAPVPGDEPVSDAPTGLSETGGGSPGVPAEGEGEKVADRSAPGEPRPSLPPGSQLGISGGDGLGLNVDRNAAPIDSRQVTVRTKSLELTFDGRGARLVRAEIPAFDEGGTQPVQLLPEGSGALASVVARGAQEFPLDQFVFRLVSDTQGPEGRRLVWELPLDEITLRKTFVVPPQGYVIRVDQELVEDHVNLTAWGLSWAGGMRRTEERLGQSRGDYFTATVLAEGELQRKGPTTTRKGPHDYPGHTYFISVQNKYFVGAVVPRGESQGPARLWRVAGENDEPTMAAEILVDRTQGIAANTVSYDVYIGPLDYAGLKELGLGIERTVDLGARWIQPLSRMILSLLISLHHVIPNYGFVLILFSSAMNLLFFPLTFKSTKSMREMSNLKPQLDALKEKYKDDQQKLSEATMRLYKEAGVNPLAGCLPILVQMPIFFALYAVLFHTIELRQEPFLFWIRDLSQPDVIFHLPFSLPMIGSGFCLLPIVMGVTSFFQSKMTMVDPNQKTMMYMMPIMMTFIFFSMPSGLVLYWLTSNLFTIGTKFFLKPTPPPALVVEGAESGPVEEGSPAGNGGKKRGGRRRAAKAGAK